MPTPPTPRQRTTLQRRVIRATTERLPLKGAAIFFALVLWFVVSTEEPSEDRVEVRLLITTDTLVEPLSPLPRVTATVVGRNRELLKLYADRPVIRRTVTGETADTVTLRLSPADVEIPTGVEARVSDVQPRAITLSFVVRDTRVVPVRSALAVAVDSGRRLTNGPRFEPESVRVTGRRTAVLRVDAVMTARQSVPVRGDSVSQEVALDTARLGSLRVTPSRVRVHLQSAIVPPDTARPAVPDTAAARASRDTARRRRGDTTGRVPPPAGTAGAGRP